MIIRDNNTFSTLAENREQANIKVQRVKRQASILNILEDNPQGLTAREVTKVMYERGYIKYLDPNYARPRIHELLDKGLIEVLGKKKDPETERYSAVFYLPNEEGE